MEFSRLFQSATNPGYDKRVSFHLPSKQDSLRKDNQHSKSETGVIHGKGNRQRCSQHFSFTHNTNIP